MINLIIRLLLAFYITRQFSPTLFSVDYVRLKKLSRYKNNFKVFKKTNLGQLRLCPGHGIVQLLLLLLRWFLASCRVRVRIVILIAKAVIILRFCRVELLCNDMKLVSKVRFIKNLNSEPDSAEMLRLGTVAVVLVGTCSIISIIKLSF